MDPRLLRAYFVELIGTFGFVLIAGGLSCVNVMTTAAETSPGSAALTLQQPGLLGVALGQALIWMALVAWSAPVSGGYLNPAITVMRWVFNRLPTDRLAWFLGAQLIASVMAGLVLKLVFEPSILRTAHFGAPFLNPLAYPTMSQDAIWAGLGLELVLTFFLVLAMFVTVEGVPAPWLSAGVLAAATLFAGPLTGAGLNPARWFGPTFWRSLDGAAGSSPGQQALVYIAGPIVGALLAGLFVFRIYTPAVKDRRDESVGK